MESPGTTKIPKSFPVVTHHETRHLGWATLFAIHIAFRKRRDELIPSDLLPGIYVANLESVSGFWSRPQGLDDFVAEHCEWHEPRWLTWQKWHDESRKATRRFRFPFWITFGEKRWASSSSGLMFKQSPDWTRLFETGERLTPYKATCRNCTLPLLTPEIMLLAFIQTEGNLLGKHLQETGLMIDKLEEAANRRIDNPDKLML